MTTTRDEDAIADLRSVTPLKQKLADIVRFTKWALFRKWAIRHQEFLERNSQFLEMIRDTKKRNKRVRLREERQRAREAPQAKINEAAEKRLKLLLRATSTMRTDKLLQQLRGREQDITTFWQAMALAGLKHGRAGSDAEVALVFTDLTGKACNRHLARSRRQIVRQLEERANIWQEVARWGA